MTDTMTDEKALGLVRWLLNGSDATPPPPDVTLEQAYNHIAARLAQQPAMAPALDVFKIAGGDVECSPEPTAEIALDCLRDLRQCYEEVLSQQPAAALPEHWLAAIVELYGSEAEDLTMLEQRARDLAQEGK